MKAHNDKRRWFQLSLRTFLLLVVFCGAGGGWFGRQWYSAAAQRSAVASIRQLEFQVYYDYECYGSGNFRTPQFLVDLLGEDFCCNAVWVGTINGPASYIRDSDLIQLRTLPRLKYLVLAYSEVTDDGLEKLTHLKNLESVNLSGTQVSDAELMHLTKCASLKELILNNTKVTKRGVRMLQSEMPELYIKCDAE